jgi:hypothetical protein
MIRQNISLLMSQPLEFLLDMLLKRGIDLDNHLDLNFVDETDEEFETSQGSDISEASGDEAINKL